MTLKAGLEVTQDHSNWYIRKLGYGFLLAVYSNSARICTVCEISSIKAWSDLENWVRGSLRSLKMAPFNRTMDDFVLVGHCKYSSIVYHFRVI